MSEEEYLMQFFKWGHLPSELHHWPKMFTRIAEQVDMHVPNNPEKTTALRKLLEAKDCAVRAELFKDVETKPYTQP